MAEARIVKRYANRKLYDTQRSRYVTLDQIADMIRSGEDVKIIDNNSKDDLTSVTLAQILFEEEKKQKSFLPLSAMRNLIQTGGQSIQQLATQAGELATQAGEKVRSVFRRDGSRVDDGGPEEAEAAPVNPGAAPLREFLERSQQTFDEWQKRVDERIRHAVEALSPLGNLEKEIRALNQRVEELEKKLDRE